MTTFSCSASLSFVQRRNMEGSSSSDLEIEDLDLLEELEDALRKNNTDISSLSAQQPRPTYMAPAGTPDSFRNA